MEPGTRKYKTYLEPNSTQEIPKSSAFNKRKREDGPNDDEVGTLLSPFTCTDADTRQVLNETEQGSLLLEHDNEPASSGCTDTDNDDEWMRYEENREQTEQHNEIQENREDMEENIEDTWFDVNDVYNEEYHACDYPDDDQPTDDAHIFEQKEPQEKDDRYDPYLSETLSADTTITRGEALLMCLTLAIRHSFTWSAIIDVLKLVNTLFNKKDAVPQSKYKLFQYVPVDVDCMKYHLYCRFCKTYLAERKKITAGNLITCSCGLQVDESESSYFLSVGFASQLKQLLQNAEVVMSLQYRFQRIKTDVNSFDDIYDGNMYQKLYRSDGPLSNQWNLSYTLNTDGCQAANSSKISLWPIYATINELPPNMRAKHMILIGLWADKNEPNMDMFLSPFVDEANTLSTDGLQWQLGDETITSLIIPSACSVDSIARADMLNMKRMNAVNGCTFCEHETECIDSYRRYTVSTKVFPDRSDESIKQNMLSAFHQKTDVCGVKKPSVLMNLRFFDLANGMVPDYMHSVLLGVTRQHTELLLSSPGEDYYAGTPNQKEIINRRLDSITPPSCITRTPRSIDERKMWKASEWRSWLVWYILICLHGLIPEKYINHIALLVSAINTLLQSSITPDGLKSAHILLVKYVVLFQKFFGKRSMTYNVHLLLHLSKSVENWGPLWATNCFSFENENRLLLLMKKSPTCVQLQITRRYLFTKSLINFSSKFSVSHIVTQFCEKLYDNAVKFSSRLHNCVLIGSGKRYELNDEETQCNQYRYVNCKQYQKMIYKGKRYVTESYGQCRKTNDSIVQISTGLVGVITNICWIENDCDEEMIIVFLRDLRVDPSPYITTNNVKVSYIRRCYPEIGILHSCLPESVIDQCILLKVDNKCYVSNIPRGCLGD